jgi:hypothetical protein
MIAALAQTTAPAETLDYIPPMDQFGLPAPAGLFLFLLILTMLLHLLFMNFTLGGAIVATGLDTLTLAGRGNHNHTVRVIWQVLPVTLSLTITTGVAPLLFVQTLYGQFFYSANIFLGWTWFAIVPILIVAFYLAYYLSYRLSNVVTGQLGRWDRRPGRRLLVSLVCAVLFACIAWILTNNHMLSVQPEVWARDGAWKHNRLAVTPLKTVPRYLHNLGGSLVLTGLWLTGIGWWRRTHGVDPPEIAGLTIRTGLWLTLGAVVAAAVFGPVFFFMLPAEVRATLLTPGLYSVLWWIALLGVVGQIVLGLQALQQPERFAWFGGLAACVLLTLVGMLSAREQVRLAYLGRAQVGFAPEKWPVHPQVSSLILFGVLLLVVLAAVIWLTWVATAGRRTAPSATHEA